MAQQEIRTYEISVWTLQDDYITVLKPAHTENKGQIQDAKMTLKTDGTQELKFKIPIYIYDNGKRVENPIWYTTKEGVFVENLRKIKVIFNKATNEEAVFEFIITKVTDEHNKDELYCNVECEGLAFNELGKVGYKISLSSEDFYEDYDTWFFDENHDSNSEPMANIDYWLNKFMTKVPAEGFINPAEWHYEISMDWSSYSDNRESSKIYDDAYIGSWTTTSSGLTPNEIVDTQEKARLIDIEESNIYNITQQLAETFNVFCRYEYDHDKSYHITGRRIVFYNHFFYENDGYIDLTYPYSTDSIKREIDSADLVTKMFVKPVETTESDSGLITIMDVAANKSKEDYVMNFDYLHDIETISNEQYNAIEPFEEQMREYNIQLIVLENQIIDYNNQITPVRAQKTISENAIQLDKERLSQANSLLNNLTGDDGTIAITENHPDTAILLPDKDDAAVSGSYYINLSKKGIDSGSLKIYRTYEIVPNGSNTGCVKELSDELSTGILIYDDFGELIKVTNLYKATANGSNRVYLTYNYTPRLYYEKVVQTWTHRLAKDQADLNNATTKLTNLETALSNVQSQYNTLLSTKKDAIKAFERMMGPALREGYWLPDDFKDYGNHYVDWWTNIRTVITASQQIAGTQDPDKQMDYFLWDNEPFYDEQLSYYFVGADTQRCNYPCVVLPNGILTNDVQTNTERLKQLTYMFYDYSPSATNPYEDRKRRCYSLGSECQLGFTKINNEIKPVLILTGVESLPVNMSTAYQHGAYVGSLETYGSNNEVRLSSWSQSINSFLTSNVDLVYPRIVVKSMAMKTATNQLSVGYNQVPWTAYEDYYVTSRIVGEIPCYYITPKPEALLRQGGLDKTLSVSYVVSNADVSVYLDALQIIKENAYPKVSYNIDTNIVDHRFMREAYNMLSHLVHINDLDLKFKNVRGYISEAELNLDKPWDDEFKIKNYRNKFEDLFSSIVAQTAEMKKSSGVIDMAASSFTSSGEINPDLFQNSLRKIDLNYAFNHGKLTIDEENGIWGISEAGVVAFRGGGIFTATTKDRGGNWIWNTGIVPQGINADLITTGQLDTNRIMVYAGDKLRFQLNGEGLFAYKSFFEDLDALDLTQVSFNGPIVTTVNQKLASGGEIDSAQFVKLDENGLFFIVKDGALILNKDKTNYIEINGIIHDPFGYDNKVTFIPAGGSAAVQAYNEHGIPYHAISDIGNNDVWIYDDIYTLVKYEKAEGETVTFTESAYGTFIVPSDGIQRVSITWDGLTLRNYNNEKVFYADPDTGNLEIKGRLVADSVYIVKRDGNTEALDTWVDTSFEDHVQTSENLAAIFNEAGTIIEDSLIAISDLENLTIENSAILGNFYNDILNGLKDDRIIKLYGSSSVDIYSGDADVPSSVSVISASKDRGVWIGSGKAITLFSGSLPQSGTTTTGATVRLAPDKIMFGVDSTGSATVVEMTKNYAIFAAANQLADVESANAASWTAANASVSGVKITKDGIWLATGTGVNRSLISMQPGELTLGVAPNSGNSGSFIKLSEDEMLIGANTNIYINANNIALDSTGAQETGSDYSHTYFRLGSVAQPGLIFDGTNLYIRGHIYAANTYVIDSTGTTKLFETYLDDLFEKEVEVTSKLKAAFDKAGEIVSKGANSLDAIDSINLGNLTYLSTFKTDVKAALTPNVTHGPYHKVLFKPGDVWEKAETTSSLTQAIYVATAHWNEVYATEALAEAGKSTTKGWTRTSDYSLAAITGANLSVDAEAGTIDISAGKAVTITSAGTIYLGANQDVNIVGNENVNIGGTTINIASSSTSINDLGGIHLVAAKYDGTAISGYTGQNASTVDIDARGITLAARNGIQIESDAGITIKSSSVTNASVLEINRTKGIWMGTDQTISLFSVSSIDNQTQSGAAVEMNSEHLIFGMSSISATETAHSVVEMTPDFIIAAVGASAKILKDGYEASTSVDPYTTLKNNSTVTGVVIEKDNFGIATSKTVSSQTIRNLILMDKDGIYIGNASSYSTLSNGSYINLGADGNLRIGSAGNLYINTTNVAINSSGEAESSITYPSSVVANQKTYLRLGPTNSWGLLFDGANLWLKGNLYAVNTNIIVNNTTYTLDDYLDNNYTENYNQDKEALDNELDDIFEEMGRILNDAQSTLKNVNNDITTNKTILTDFVAKINGGYTPVKYTRQTAPTTFNRGDIWDKTNSSGTVIATYIATAGSNERTNGAWTRTYNGSLAEITGASIDIDSVAGTIDMKASSTISIAATTNLSLLSESIDITGNYAVNIGGPDVNIGSTSSINIVSASTASSLDGNGVTNYITLNSDGITLFSGKKIELGVNSSSTAVSLISIDPSTGLLLGSSTQIKLFANSITSATGSQVLIDPENIRLAIGKNSSDTSAVYITPSTITLSVGNIDRQTFTGSYLQITKDRFYFSTAKSSSGSILDITPSLFKMVAMTNSSGTESTASLVKISTSGIEIGSSSYLKVLTSNFYLDSDGKILRLGSENDYKLLYNNGNLNIKGNITAASFSLDAGATIDQNGTSYSLSDMQSEIDSVNATTITVDYNTSTSSSTVPTSGWSTARPTSVSQGEYLWTRTTITYANNQSKTSYQISYQGEDGGSGTNGYNTATVYLYQRAASSPTKPSSALTYTFSTKTLSGTLGNWTQTIPSGTDPIYVTVATAYSTTDTDSIAANEWSSPVILAQNGSNGANGLNVATVFLYRRASSTPSIPSAAVTYTFATGEITGLTNSWTKDIPTSNGNPCYVIQATASNTAATDSIPTSEWSSPVILVRNGVNGDDGNKWYTGTALTGSTSSASTGITYAYLGDMYLNTNTSDVYECTTAGASGTATWTRKNNIKGSDGSDGGIWYSGTSITGTSTTATIFSSSGITYANVGDMYLNTNTSNTYRCTTAGSASVAKWVYVNNIKGNRGFDGAGVASVRQLYYLKTNSTTPPQPSSSTGISDQDYQNTWTTVVPTYSSNGQYYRCEETNYTDASKTYSTVYRDYALETANKNATDASQEAAAIASTLNMGTFSNGVFSKYTSDWGTVYDVALTGTQKLLVASGEVAIGSFTYNGNTNATMVLKNSGIALHGASINLTATSDTSTSVITLSPTDGITIASGKDLWLSGNSWVRIKNSNGTETIDIKPGGIELKSTSSISLASGGISLSGGTIALTGGSISLSSDTSSITMLPGGIAMNASKIRMTGGEINLTSGGSINLTGGSITMQTSGYIQFLDSNDNVLFAATQDGGVSCTSLTINGDLVVTGTINGNFANNKTTTGVSWLGTFNNRSGSSYYFALSGTSNLVSGTTYTLTATVTFKNITTTSGTFDIGIHKDSSTLLQTVRSSEVLSYQTKSVMATLTYTATSNESPWTGMYVTVYKVGSAAIQNNNTFSDVAAPQVTLVFEPN